MGKDSPSPPAAPDYAGAAQAQGAANVEAARLSARMANPNIIGPYGSQTVTYGQPSFDQAGYDKAVQAYGSGQGIPTQGPGGEQVANANPPGQPPRYMYMSAAPGAGGWRDMPEGVANQRAPTREDYTQTINGDQPTVTQTLTPAAQATLDAQQRVQRSLAGLGEQGIGTAQRVLGTPFSFGGPAIQTSLGNAGQIPQAPDLSSYGQASGLSSMLSSLPKQPPKSYTNPSDFEGLTFASKNNLNVLGTTKYLPGTSKEKQLRGEAPYMTRDNYERQLNDLRLNQAMDVKSQMQQIGRMNTPSKAELASLDDPFLARVNDRNSPRSLGQTSYAQDPQFQARMNEFRAGGMQMGQTSSDFDANGLPIYQRPREQIDFETSMRQPSNQPNGNLAQAPQAPELSVYGMAGSNVNAQPVNQGPQAGQYGMAGAGPSAGQYGFAGGGPSGGQYGLAGANVQAGAINQGPQTGQYGLASGSLNTGNVAAMPVNAGMTGQQAIMSRLDPSIARNRVSTETQLINQGLRPGGEAYNNAINLLGQQENDQRTQAVLQGIGLDTAANAQGFGQALQGGQFGNQAIAQNFNQAQAAQAAQNAAQQQGYAQQFGLAGLQNQAVGQNFGQGVTSQQLQNAGIGQNFGQGQAANAAANQAVGLNFNQGLAAQQAQNAAAQQLYNQNMGVQGLQNQAIGQNQQAALAQYQSQLGGQQQGFGQQVTQRQLSNQAISQNQQTALAQQQAAMGAQNQQFNQGLSGAQFANTAQQNALAQALQGRQMTLNEITALMSGSQIQNPTFQAYQGQSVAPAPVAQAAAQQAQFGQNIYNQQMGQANANTTGLYNLGGQAAMAYALSDRRLKSNIERIGTHPLGIGIYEYDIFGKRDVGMMADEVQGVSPASVITHPSGFQMVDYRSIPNG